MPLGEEVDGQTWGPDSKVAVIKTPFTSEVRPVKGVFYLGDAHESVMWLK